MTSAKELIRWLKTLPKDASVWVDEGGLTLQSDSPTEEAGQPAYFEIGGESENDEQENED